MDEARSRPAVIPLKALSGRQRGLVERNLPLVNLTLRRFFGTGPGTRSVGGRLELFQEGCLALVEALRSHDPARHGHFAAYAMARIRESMNRYLHEERSAIRIPYITQRRHRARKRTTKPEEAGPGPFPRVIDVGDLSRSSGRLPAREGRVDRSDPAPAVTIGDLVRDCYDRALRHVVAEMKASPRAGSGTRDVLERCFQQRWLIPEPSSRTSLRQLARELDCSLGRITHCEERLRRRLASELEGNARFRALVRLGRRRSDGMRHGLSDTELDLLRCADDPRQDPGNGRRVSSRRPSDRPA